MNYLYLFIFSFFIFLLSCTSPNSQIESNSSINVSSLKNEIDSIEKKESNKIPNPINVYNDNFVPYIPDSLIAPNLTNEYGQRMGKWIIFYDSNWVPTEYTKAFYYRKINYKTGKPSGLVYDFYINGNKQWEGQILTEGETDILKGKCCWYNSDGIIEKKNIYINGKLHGKETLYFDNGKVKSIRNYANGVLNGKYVEYNLSGDISNYGQYLEGSKSGKWRYYDTDGDYKITEFIPYRVGAICNDGSRSYSTGRGTCSHHGGVNYWLVEYKETFIGGNGKYSFFNKTNGYF